MLETLALLTEAAALQFIDNFVDVNQDRMAIQCESYGYQACQLNMRNNEWLSGGLAVSGALFANITGVYFNMRYATAAGTLTCIVCVCVCVRHAIPWYLELGNDRTVRTEFCHHQQLCVLGRWYCTLCWHSWAGISRHANHSDQLVLQWQVRIACIDCTEWGCIDMLDDG
jgi:hypothetical protein